MTTSAFAVLALPVLFATHPAAEPPQQKPPEASASAQAPARLPATAVNVRFELTISDQRGDAAVAAKTVTLLVAETQSGRVRTGNGGAMLNVDVRPEIVREGRIRAVLSVEYVPRSGDADKIPPLPVTESLAVMLDDGKSVLVAQTADPGSDRKVRLEVKATIVR
jgi:hypothetical protein